MVQRWHSVNKPAHTSTRDMPDFLMGNTRTETSMILAIRLTLTGYESTADATGERSA